MGRKLGNGGMGGGGQGVTRENGGIRYSAGERRPRRPRDDSRWAGKDGRLFMTG